jgi:hypothetical protein
MSDPIIRPRWNWESNQFQYFIESQDGETLLGPYFSRLLAEAAMEKIYGSAEEIK